MANTAKVTSAQWLCGLISLVTLFSIVSALSCSKSSPPIDTSNAPWLDLQVQIKNLRDKDFRVRGVAAFNLGNLGAKAESAVPELERLAQEDAEQKVRERAKEALEKIRGTK